MAPQAAAATFAPVAYPPPSPPADVAFGSALSPATFPPQHRSDFSVRVTPQVCANPAAIATNATFASVAGMLACALESHPRHRASPSSLPSAQT
jgi:hypothetical protein